MNIAIFIKNIVTANFYNPFCFLFGMLRIISYNNIWTYNITFSNPDISPVYYCSFMNKVIFDFIIYIPVDLFNDIIPLNFFILFIGIIIFKTHDDFPFYHFPYSYYITQNPLHIGVGLFNSGFKTPSSIFYLNSLFYLPIKSSFISDGNNFDKTILDYVGTSTRNR